MIAYYISNFPKLSEKFVSREISIIRSKEKILKYSPLLGLKKNN